jgi:hypothetical protein
LLQLVVEVVKCGASISECCVPPIARWRQLMCEKKRVAGSPRIKTGVYMEVIISLNINVSQIYNNLVQSNRAE